MKSFVASGPLGVMPGVSLGSSSPAGRPSVRLGTCPDSCPPGLREVDGVCVLAGLGQSCPPGSRRNSKGRCVPSSSDAIPTRASRGMYGGR